MFRAMAIALYCCTVVFIFSGKLGSNGLVLSYYVVTITLHNIIILTMACLSTSLHLQYYQVLQWQVELRHDPTTEFADWRVREKLVNEVIESLELHRIRHSFIGGASVRGISGGQRKRVNVAMELMSKPRILFLDGKSKSESIV